MSSKQIKGLIIDIDGVLFEGSKAIGSLQKSFDKINALNLPFIIATNNSGRSRADCIGLFEAHGVKLDIDQVVSSVSVTLRYLEAHFCKKASVYVLGSKVLKSELLNAGYVLIDNIACSADAVIIGIDKDFDYEKLKYASLHIQRGAVFIATNDDKTVKSPDGLIPAAGSIVAAVEAATAVKAKVMGKPHQPMFDLALQHLSINNDQVLMIGDQLETDIKGAQVLGLQTALVLSGVCSNEQAIAWLPAIDIIEKDFTALIDAIYVDKTI